MLQFTDLNMTQHFINVANLNNVQVSNKNGQLVMSFHMTGHHIVPVSIDKATADRLIKELGATK